MTFMGENESFDEDYFSGGGLDTEIEGSSPAVEEEDPFSALDDFAVEGNSVVEPDLEKDVAGEDELAVVEDTASANELESIEAGVGSAATGVAGKLGRVTALPSQKRISGKKSAPTKLKKSVKKSGKKAKTKPAKKKKK